jgi:hypothetical protein
MPVPGGPGPNAPEVPTDVQAVPQPQVPTPAPAEPVPDPEGLTPVDEVAAVPVEIEDPEWTDGESDGTRTGGGQTERDTQPGSPETVGGTPAPEPGASPTLSSTPSAAGHEVGREHHRRDAGDKDGGAVSIDTADLLALGDDLRNAAGELQSIAARLGPVRAALGLSPAVGAAVEELAGQHAKTLESVAAELVDEAGDLVRRARQAEEADRGGDIDAIAVVEVESHTTGDLHLITDDGTVTIPDAIVTDEKVVQVIEVDLPEGAEPGDEQLVEMIDEALADDEEIR